MVSGRHKSGTLRKVFRKVPGNRTTVQYRKREPSLAKCAGCKTELKGVLRKRPFKMHNLAKTKKRPERKYGGYFCSSCAREKMIEETRKK